MEATEGLDKETLELKRKIEMMLDIDHQLSGSNKIEDEFSQMITNDNRKQKQDFDYTNRYRLDDNLNELMANTVKVNRS